jgi:2-keto-3-deoxy-L-rhamnonate aldolase RhmA
VSSALASALAVLEAAKNPEVRAAFARVSKGTRSLGEKAGIVPEKSPGPGRYILIGIGVVAFAGVAYAAWQTLRADDSLWIEDDPEPT